MTGYLSIVKTADKMIDEMLKRGGLCIEEAELFVPFAGEIPSSFFDLTVEWLKEQGTITRSLAWDTTPAAPPRLSITPKGAAEIVRRTGKPVLLKGNWASREDL